MISPQGSVGAGDTNCWRNRIGESTKIFISKYCFRAFVALPRIFAQVLKIGTSSLHKDNAASGVDHCGKKGQSLVV